MTDVYYNEIKRVMDDTGMDYLQAYHHVSMRKSVIQQMNAQHRAQVRNALEFWTIKNGSHHAAQANTPSVQ